ncbi:class 1 fructose-bisphosphatase [Methylopila sp. M107]|uniref:class 1 fructose-bisphosphatase n=1 Tax=Methylopila sp. M107 TaxID=1101190 RepID=UPI0003690085|nr:class 1 fructose-bisphosphatase [Methylopila sp. M107]
MAEPLTLEAYLDQWAAGDAARGDVGKTVLAMCVAAREIAAIVGRGALEGDMAAAIGGNAGGDTQKALDLRTHDITIEALKAAPVARVGSEEADDVAVLDEAAPLAVAMDPLDGSSNIETNVSIGTLFGVLPHVGEDTFLQPGSKQLAAGFVVYGPATALVLTVGAGTQIFMLERGSDRFLRTHADVRIAETTKEYAINQSNVRHWDAATKGYIDDCLAGETGPRSKNFNMRWVGSLVADVFRILIRGGVYLYPGDRREGYGSGRLRLVYECNPIAMVAEQAGGKATDGKTRILDLTPQKLHARCALVVGSAEEVDRFGGYYGKPASKGGSSPLFAKRGLFLA